MVIDLRSLPLSMPKTNLERLLARRPDRIFAAAHKFASRHEQSDGRTQE
jgi:hypothetical protein